MAGVFPVLKHDIFSLLFLSRCFFGLGIGLFNRLIIQMISSIFQEDPRRKATVIGLESAFEGYPFTFRKTYWQCNDRQQ